MGKALNQKIDFITIEKVKEGSITKGEKEVIHYSCRASVIDVSGTEFNSGNAEWQQLKASFRVRFCDFTKKLILNTKKYLIKYNGISYNIEFASNYKQKNLYIDVKATMIK